MTAGSTCSYLLARAPLRVSSTFLTELMSREKEKDRRFENIKFGLYSRAVVERTVNVMLMWLVERKRSVALPRWAEVILPESLGHSVQATGDRRQGDLEDPNKAPPSPATGALAEVVQLTNKFCQPAFWLRRTEGCKKPTAGEITDFRTSLTCHQDQ